MTPREEELEAIRQGTYDYLTDNEEVVRCAIRGAVESHLEEYGGKVSDGVKMGIIDYLHAYQGESIIAGGVHGAVEDHLQSQDAEEKENDTEG